MACGLSDQNTYLKNKLKITCKLKINVAHLNVNGILTRGKHDELSDLIQDTNLHCLAISESHLKPHNTNANAINYNIL